MLRVDEQLQRLPHDGVRARPFYVNDESDAAGVFLVSRVVKSVSGRATRFAIHIRRSSYRVHPSISKIQFLNQTYLF